MKLAFGGANWNIDTIGSRTYNITYHYLVQDECSGSFHVILKRFGTNGSMPRKLINQVTYFYTQAGKGPHLLLLHGFTGSSKNWRALLPSLTAHFTVTCIDILGHGRSDSPPNPERYEMKQVAHDLITLCNQLSIAQFHLLGYSMGGRLALFTAVTYPDKILALTLESSSPGLSQAHERDVRTERDNTLANRIEADGIESFVNFWESLALWDSQKQLPKSTHSQLRQQRLNNTPQGLANSLRGMGTGVQPDLWSALATLQCPIHLIVGELDHKFVAINQQMATQFPNAMLTIVPQAGHTVHLEKPEGFLSASFSL